MRIKYFILISILVLSLAAVSCAPRETAVHPGTGPKPAIVEATERATDNLLGQCNIFMDQKEPIIVTSLVNIDDVRKSSTLGRMSSEIIANRLSQHGYQVREVKMGHNIFVSELEGEFILSRELHEIARKHDVQGFIVGTYAAGSYAARHQTRFLDTKALISLRFVDTDNNIACSYNYVVRDTDLEMWK